MDCINGDFMGVIASGTLEGDPVYISIPDGNGGVRFDLIFYVPFANMDPMPASRIARVIQMMLESKSVLDIWYAIDQFLLPQGFVRERFAFGDGITDVVEYKHADGRCVSLTSVVNDRREEEIAIFLVSADADGFALPASTAERQLQWIANAPLDRRDLSHPAA